MSNWRKLQQRKLELGPKPTSISATKKSIQRNLHKTPRLPVSSKTGDLLPIELPEIDRFRVKNSASIEEILTRDDTNLFSTQSQKSEVTSKHKKPGTFIALDCEFVGTGANGSTSELARVSIVNYFGFPLLDIYVKPQSRVTDFRTRYSGITPKHLKDAVPFKEAQTKVSDLLHNRVLVGHGLKNDMRVLLLSHPSSSTIDTQILKRYRDSPFIKGRPGLKKLLKSYLNISIQDGPHDSVEDARSCMLLLRTFKTEYLRENNIKK